MSDTPQTDAIVNSHTSDHLGKLIELSRKLERELNELNNKNTTALILTDKKTNNIVHIIVCKDEDEINKYIMKDDPKLNYQVVPNWNIVCKAVAYEKRRMVKI